MNSTTVMPYLYLKPENDDVHAFYDNHATYHKGDAGLDLFMPEDVTFHIGETKIVDLKIKCEMVLNNEKNLSYYLYPRSSISKTPLTMANSVGIIDSSYRGSIKVALHYNPPKKFYEDLYNKGKGLCFDDYKYTVTRGTRLMQICLPNLEPFKYQIVENLSTTSRGEGGFGSTGK